MKAAAQLDALTGIRIVAAAGVFLSHLPLVASIPSGLTTFMAAGYNGVTLFFILSGFVLTWSWGTRILPIRGRTLWAFFVARFARIYPVYLFTLFALVFPYFLTGGGDRRLMIIHALTLQPWLSDIMRALAFNAPAWSIGVEVFLYACFPLVILLFAKIQRSKRALLSIGALVVLAAFALAWWFVITGRADLPWSDPQSDHRWLYRTPVTRLGDFTLGVIAALLVKNFTAPRWLATSAQALGVVSIVLLMINPAVFLSAWSWDAAYMLPFTLLIWGLAAGPHTFLARALGTRPMVVMGQASFAFYLIHVWMLAVWPNTAVNFDMWVTVVTTQFIMIMFAAIGIHFGLEEPARKWLIRVLVPKKRPQPAKPNEPEELALAS